MFLQADAVRLPFADDSFDMVFTSPPYADARTYGIGAQRDCHEWIDWMVPILRECVRVTKGIVLVNCAGVTRDWRYWPGPEGLLYEWFCIGGRSWRPAYWHRVGIPGSGGKQWLRADVEYVLAFTKCKAAIPWSDNTANGHPPKWAPGGDMSHRVSDGSRVNQWGHSFDTGGIGGSRDDVTCEPAKPSHKLAKKITRRISCGKGPDGDTRQDDVYEPPVLANPGVKVQVPETLDEMMERWLATVEASDCVEGINVGGGLMGHKLAHENEAPFPQSWPNGLFVVGARQVVRCLTPSQGREAQ